MQVVIVTLDRVELLNPQNKYQKVTISLSFGENSKNIPKPRFVRSQVASFYKEKVSISSSLPSSKTVKISVFGIVKEEELLGDFSFDIKQLEKKQGVNQKFQFEAMYSSNLSISPRSLNQALEKEPAQIPSVEVTPQKQQRSVNDLVKKSSRTSNKQDASFNQIKESSLKKLNALEKAGVTQSPKLIERKGSIRKLNRSISNNANDDDRKSDISQKPSQRRFQRTSKNSAKDIDESKSESAYKPTKTTVDRQRSVTPTKSVRTNPSGQITPRAEKVRPERKQRVEVKPQPQIKFEQKDYIQFLIIAVAALILGIIVKQL